MNKWVCKNDKCEKPCYAEMSPPCYPEKCLSSSDITPNWREVDELATNDSQLPKLTVEVFDRPDCPVWAQWAAVDENGKAYYYAEDPYAGKYTWGSWYSMKIIDGKFSSSDWKNSLIERPVKKETLPDWCTVDAMCWKNNPIERPVKNTLPDWCKPGVVGYEKHTGVYFKVNKIDHDSIVLQCPYGNDNESTLTIGYFNKGCPVQARIRKYNEKEMRGLVGKIIENGNYIHFINTFDKDLREAISGSDGYTASELLEYGYIINGNPCGKFEHLENGEWVE